MHDNDNVAAMFIEIKNDVKHIYTRMDKHCEYIEALQVDQEQTKTRVTKLEVNHEILEKENNELTADNKALHKEVNELTTHKKSVMAQVRTLQWIGATLAVILAGLVTGLIPELFK